jgi:tripartite-type tricarboxylate transporter receptor subunit TctC
MATFGVTIRSLAASLFTLAVMFTPVAAQDGYPNRPITMLVGFGAGSATDVVARVVATKLWQRLGQRVVVENKTGAAGNIASELATRARPDGYTLLAVASAIATNPAVSKLNFDTERDLTPIALVGWLPTVLEVNSALPVKTVKEFVEYAKQHPGEINFGSSGTGGSTHLAGELFAMQTGIKLTHIPYRGNAQALTALMGDEIHALFDNMLGATSQASNPRIRLLAISADAQSNLLPNLPTYAEAGFPNYKASILFGFMGPAKMPKAVVDRLNQEINEVMKDPEIVQQLSTKGGMQLTTGTPGMFASVLHDEIAKWTEVAKHGNIKIDQ